MSIVFLYLFGETVRLFVEGVLLQIDKVFDNSCFIRKDMLQYMKMMKKEKVYEKK